MKKLHTRKSQYQTKDQQSDSKSSYHETIPSRCPGKHFCKSHTFLNNVKASLTNFCRCHSSSVIIPVLIYYALCFQYRQWIYDQNKASHLGRTNNHLYSKHSLFKPYSMNHEELLRIRSSNMQNWRKNHNAHSFQYNEMGIDRRNNLSLQEFSDIYDGKWPVVLTDVVPKWPAFNWTGDFFNCHYGEEHVAMKAVDFNLDAAISQVFSDLHQLSADYIDQGILSEAISLTVPLHRFYINTDKADTKSWTYIEDELFIPMRPELRNDIGDNDYLQEDFFQMFPEELRPWNAMLLWGTKYSRSSLHMDPYNWTGTSAVIRGRKWWKLYPPGQDDYSYIYKDRRSGFPLDCFKYNSAVDAFEPDLHKYPLFRKAYSILIEQLPGEMLFVPSGWYHQAYNSEETLAISSQVMNHNNYRIILEEILKAGSVHRDQLKPDIDHMSPRQQIQSIISQIPETVLRRGQAVTHGILEQLKQPIHNQNSHGRSWL